MCPPEELRFSHRPPAGALSNCVCIESCGLCPSLCDASKIRHRSRSALSDLQVKGRHDMFLFLL